MRYNSIVFTNKFKHPPSITKSHQVRPYQAQWLAHRVRDWGYLLLVALFLLPAGCEQPQIAPGVTPTPTVASGADGTASGVPLADTSATTGVQERSLVMWTPHFLDPNPDNSAGSILASVYDQFEQTHPGVRVETQIRANSGETSLYNYLRSAQKVAPNILPDVVVLDTNLLGHIVDNGLVQPLSASDVAGVIDFYPFTRESVTYKGEIYAIPYIADVIHMAYFRNQIDVAPTTWQELLTSRQTYLFPAGGREGDGNASLLLQYVGAGGQLTESGEISAPDAILSVFQFLNTASQNGVSPPSVLEYSSLSAVWPAFLNIGSGYANVSANFFLSQRESTDILGYQQVPTLSGSPLTIGHTWAFVILADDAELRALALELIMRMLAPDVHGSWSQAARRLPTRRSSLDNWGISQPYYDFLRQQLDVAISPPNSPTFIDFSKRLQSAQQKLLNKELTPEDAVLAVGAVQ